MAATDLRFIPNHVQEIMSSCELELEKTFFGEESFGSSSSRTLPETWQPILGFETQAQLQAAVDYYQQALTDSRAWLLHYDIEEAK